MKAYFDSSFLFSLYAPDDHSETAIRDMKHWPGSALVGSLGEIELLNALELRIFRRELSRRQVAQARAAFEEDLRNGVWTSVELEPAVFVAARHLILKATAKTGCRTADVLHVAAAMQSGAEKFFSFDERQRQLARIAELSLN